MLAENLSDTSERRKDWYHFYAAGGLPSLQRASLAHADLKELHFKRRVDCRARGGWVVGFNQPMVANQGLTLEVEFRVMFFPRSGLTSHQPTLNIASAHQTICFLVTTCFITI